MAGFQDANKKRKEEIMKLLKQQQQLQEYQNSKDNWLKTANKVRSNAGNIGKALSKSNNTTISNIGNKLYSGTGQRLLDQGKANALNGMKTGVNALKTKLGIGTGTAATTGATTAGTGATLGGASTAAGTSATASGVGAGLSAGAGTAAGTAGTTAATTAGASAASAGAGAGAAAGSGAATGAAAGASAIPVAGWIAAAAILAGNAIKSFNDKKKIKAMQASAQEAQKGQQAALGAKANAMQNLEQQKAELDAFKAEKQKEDALKAQTTNEILQAVTGNQSQHDSKPVNDVSDFAEINNPIETETPVNEPSVASSENNIDYAGMLDNIVSAASGEGTSKQPNGQFTGGAAYLAPAFNKGKLDTDVVKNPENLPWEQRKDIPIVKELTPEENARLEARKMMMQGRKQEDLLETQTQTSKPVVRENPFAPLPAKKDFNEAQFEIIEPPTYEQIRAEALPPVPKSNPIKGETIEQKVNNAVASKNQSVEQTQPTEQAQPTTRTQEQVVEEKPFTPDGSKESVIADILNKIKTGYKENRETGFKPENLLKQEGKSGWTKFGEAVGTSGRVLSNPYTQGLIAATIVGARNNDWGEGLEYGLNWAQNKAKSDYYQKQLTGKDIAGVLGGYDADDYKSQWYGKNAQSAIDKRNQDMALDLIKTEADLKNKESQISDREADNARADKQLELQYRNAELNDQKFLLDNAKFAETQRANQAREKLQALRIEQIKQRNSGSMSGELNIIKARLKEQKEVLETLPVDTPEQIEFKNQQLLLLEGRYQAELNDLVERYRKQSVDTVNTVDTADNFDNAMDYALFGQPQVPDYVPTI